MSKRRTASAELISACIAQGFQVKPTRKGWRVLAREGTGQATLHKTPSDCRTFKNTVSDLRRIGVDI